MRITNVSEYRKKLSQFNKNVIGNREPLIIRLPEDDDVVVLSRKDYENLQEIVYILKDKVTMASLLAGRKAAAEAPEQPYGKDMSSVFSDVLED